MVRPVWDLMVRLLPATEVMARRCVDRGFEARYLGTKVVAFRASTRCAERGRAVFARRIGVKWVPMSAMVEFAAHWANHDTVKHAALVGAVPVCPNL